MESLNKWFAKERGRKTALAEHLDISSSAISQWPEVPIKRVRAVSKFTGLSLSKLRPDLFSDEILEVA